MALMCFEGVITLGTFFANVSLYQSIVRPSSSLGGFSRVALGNAGSLQGLDNLIYNTLPKQAKSMRVPPPPPSSHGPALKLTNVKFKYSVVMMSVLSSLS